MTVLVVTFVDQAFDKKSAEVNYLCNAIDTLKKEIGRGQGSVTSGTIRGTNAVGTPNSALGSWTYTPSASKP